MLNEQLKHLNFEGDLHHFMNAAKIKADEIVVGQVGNPPVLAVLISRLIDKRELKLLREIPNKRNNFVPLTAETGDINVRIGAWIIDFKHSEWESQENAKKDPEQFILNRLAAWARVAPNVIRTYKYAHPHLEQYSRGDTQAEANWNLALEEAKNGLSIDPENSYLLRRAAECALVLDRVDAAFDYAQHAVRVDPEHIGGGCLLGDVLMGQANATEALEQYKHVSKKDSQHPLSYYSAAYAVTIVVKVIRDWVIDSLRKDSSPVQKDLLKKYIARTDQLLGRAITLFDRSAEKFVKWDYEARADYGKNYYSVHNSFSAAEAVLLSGDFPVASGEFEKFRSRYPDDESILKGLMRARLEQRGVAEELVKNLDSILKATEGF